MATIRRSFTDEFKREAASLLASSGRPLTQVATELGIQPSMQRTWRGAVNGTAKTVLAPARLRCLRQPSPNRPRSTVCGASLNAPRWNATS